MRVRDIVLSLALLTFVGACGQGGGADQQGDLVQDARGAAASGQTADEAAQPAAPAGVAGVATNNQTPVGTREIADPEDLQIALLYYQVAGVSPPLQRWVESDYRYQSANEFDRARIREQIQQEYQSQLDNVQDVGFVSLSTRTQFGEYSTQYGEYVIQALRPGQMFVYNAQGNRYELAIENGTEAQRWRLAADEAERIFRDNRNSRDVVVTMRLAIVGAIPSGSGGRLRGRVKSYQILGGATRNLLGEVIVEP